MLDVRRLLRRAWRLLASMNRLVIRSITSVGIQSSRRYVRLACTSGRLKWLPTTSVASLKLHIISKQEDEDAFFEELTTAGATFALTVTGVGTNEMPFDVTLLSFSPRTVDGRSYSMAFSGPSTWFYFVDGIAGDVELTPSASCDSQAGT